jgi:hypothetical protein
MAKKKEQTAKRQRTTVQRGELSPGTALRARHKGRELSASIVEGEEGRPEVEFEGARYPSLSAAGKAAGGTPSEDESLPAAAEEPVLTPKPTRAVEHTPIPAVDPEPLDEPISEPTTEPVAVATPSSGPVPTPTVAPAPTGAHVSDLVASIRKVGKKVKVSVEIHVHDSDHNPVGGATVSGQWAGDIGSASCVTGPTGSCAVQTDPLPTPGSVTLTVMGIADAGEP